MKIIYPSIITLLLSTSFLFANDKKGKNEKEFGLEVSSSNAMMTIDGVINMEEWGETAIIKNFIQQIPKEGLPATENTEVRLKYDEDFLYVAATLYTKTTGDYVVSSLKRDFEFDQNDAFAIVIGPYDDGNNGFMFAVSPFNIQMEGLVNSGDRVSSVWDNKWFSEVKGMKIAGK
ncbi:carbohydrate binding family 9 domain-containing protein [Belliella baltica]|uniref:carbohydrate binding family 9 domain-containing protein n=1 Tax=Belliella baltica TaxID=232259 RepID=UPI001FE08A70|nr:carbohydrate binding family 9 domain-containing protein [Belliella baltica]